MGVGAGERRLLRPISHFFSHAMMAVDTLSTANKYAPGRQLCAGAIEDVADIEAGDQFAVAVDVVLRKIGEKTTAAADHFQESASRMVIMRMGLEMSNQVVDACGEDGDLYFR